MDARRLAALLAAGIAPQAARRYAGVERMPPPLAQAVDVATAAGAPLAPTLARAADVLARAAGLRRDLDVAFAGPAATAKLVSVLPAIGLLIGVALGFDSLHVLFATPLGWCCLVVGAGLMLAAHLWSRALIRRATPADVLPGLALDLLAIAMSSGASVERARAIVAAAGADATDASAEAVARVLALATEAGVPTVPLLRAEADLMRAEADARGRQAAASVAVKLMLPLAVCVLPAFMVLGVVPVMVALFSSTGVVF